jgi:hypothetical protein
MLTGWWLVLHHRVMRLEDHRPAGAALTWLPFLLFAATVVVVTPLADDVWWRLFSGERILETGRVQDQNGWAYRDPGAPWVNHAAGHDTLVAAVRRATGMTGLVLLYLAALLGLAAFLPRPRLRTDWLWALAWPPLLFIHHALRPYVFSDVLFFLAMLGAVRWHDRDAPGWKDAAPLWALFLVWGQLHGAVWPGLAFTWLFAARWRRLVAAPKAELLRLLPLAPLPLLSLANVQHGRGLLLAWRYATGDFAWLGKLTEWQPGEPAVLLVTGVFAAGFVLACRARRLRIGRLVPLVPLAVAGVLQVRHLPWLVIGALALLRATETPVPVCPRRRLRWVAAGALGALALVAAWRHAPRLAEPRFLPSALYDGMDAGCRLDRPLRVFTLHAWGGSLVHRFDGRLAPFVDARNDCFSRETFERYFRITKLEEGWYRLLWEDRPDAAALPPGHPLARALISRGWTPGITARDGVLLLAPHRAGLCAGP